MRAASVILSALLLAACAPTLPEYDPGGSPTLAMARVTDASQNGREVSIRGICFSSCALKLAATSLCVSPSAQIGVHEVRKTPEGIDYQFGARDEVWTAFFQNRIRECARKLFVSLGGFQSGRLVTASGSEILAACPTMRACG